MSIHPSNEGQARYWNGDQTAAHRDERSMASDCPTTRMTFKQHVISALVRQGGRPRGLIGQLFGLLFAYRLSNRRRNLWAVTLLDVQPADRVLEIGFGPGIAIEALSRRATAGHVYGIDHSTVMVGQATRRNAAAIREGRVTLRCGSVEELPAAWESFDKILAVNSMGFWPDIPVRLKELRARLRPGRQIAIVSQPRCPGATSETSKRAAQEIQAALMAAGFSGIHIATLNLKPPVVCITGGKAEAYETGERN